MPFSSSPWMPAVRQSVGPGWLPRATRAGIGTGPPANVSPETQETRHFSPGAIVSPSSSIACHCDCARADVAATHNSAVRTSPGSLDPDANVIPLSADPCGRRSAVRACAQAPGFA